jgi:hypothetical protein
MIIESNIDFNRVEQSLQLGDSFWIPVYSDKYRHYVNNRISFIYIYSIADNQDYIVPFHHMDCLNLKPEQLQHLTSPHSIFVLGKKRFQYTYGNTCYDADLFAWWHTNKMLPLDETNTNAHDMWSKWWYNETNTNDWLPITRHLERCVNMRMEFMKLYSNSDISTEFKVYDTETCGAFGKIEQCGVWQSTGQLAHTEYNLYTSTGRPSNKFGGINYAALNKEDGSRKLYTSRFSKGMLVEYDYDAYHVRLIASLIDYKLPSGSVHTYFGKQYFDTTDLTEEQYEQSKQITFRLLYGGIDDDFAQIPFFNKVRQFINKLWKEFKLTGYIVTPIYKRKMQRDNLHDMNANKLFNYLLQATETEHNIKQVLNVNALLDKYKSRLVLYTYDSFLFDFDMSDGKQVLHEIQTALSDNNQYPVKLKAGVNYNDMRDMTNRLS